ncbi:MAG: zinc-binding alcohol dehydrogenase family protein [Clostridiales bacterium]|nr:zinc-binding alcohol dehydrogenase family protein [Clostridiales bacterium]
MKKLLIEKPKQIVIKECEIPEIREGEALLKMVTGGICGSDLGVYRGTMAYGTYPRIPGHEFAAQIIKINGDPMGFSEGQLVTANPYFNCGSCYSCQRGFVNCCTDNKTMGVQRDGAFSEYFVMPTERLIDGGGLPADELALIEPFCISYHGIKRARVKSGEKVLVIGGGTIGILAMYAAKLYGAKVYICDVAQDKLDKALELGADGVLLNNDPEKFDEKVNELTDGNGFDVTVEAVGLPSTFQNAIDAAAYRARIIQVGIGKRPLNFDFTVIQKKELCIMGSRNAFMSEFKELIELVKRNNIQLRNVVTNEYHFTEAQKAFKDFDENQGTMLKVLLHF